MYRQKDTDRKVESMDKGVSTHCRISANSPLSTVCGCEKILI